MKVTLEDSTHTKVLANASGFHVAWFQNFDTTNGIRLYPVKNEADDDSSAPDGEFFLPPASSSTHPSSLIIQSSGADETSVARSWRAYQASGGTIDFYCGRF